MCAADRMADVPIERYGLIGDAGSAALVSADGSIDWLCLPSFDSDPVFGRLLDPDGGHCSMTASHEWSSTRRYLPGTPVLETTITTESGRATLTDFFVALPRERKDARLSPFRWLCRRLEGLEGTASVTVEVAPRDPFGRGRWDPSPGGGAVAFRNGGRAVFVASSAPFVVQDGAAISRIEVDAGHRAYLCLAYADRDIGVVPPVGEAAEDAFRETVEGWRGWSERLRCADRYRDVIERSVLTLKLLTFAASGAVVAAPTTSLPEVAEGDRNWDYRYSWIRDASRSVVALIEHGHPEDAKAYLFWLSNATRLTAPRVETLYGLNGETTSPERTIAGVRGYRGSRPVRKGNAAGEQFQLDNWAYLADAALAFTKDGGDLPEDVWSSVRGHAEFAASNWRRPDHGIWEFRDRPRHFVHSKAMCWVALDRALKLASALSRDAPTQRWKAAGDEIRAAVLDEGVDPASGSFVRAFDDPVIDASLLELSIVGFVDGADPRMLATIDRVRSELGHDELVRRPRAEDGLGGEEGAFLPCSFWLAHALALAGRTAEAKEVFEAACARTNDLGLLPEEIDPGTGSFLGNFPQGLTHLALLAAARALGGQPSGG
jgi:GH15 family glucan-1,4-alpha-glucosidase